MSSETLFEPVSSDEEDVFESDYESISDDYLSDISDFEYCILDEESNDIEIRGTISTFIHDDREEQKETSEPPNKMAGSNNKVQCRNKCILRGNSTNGEKRDTKSLSVLVTTHPEARLGHRRPRDELADCPAEPSPTHKVKSCLKEFGDKVDGRNFDIMSLYTWGTKAQLQEAVDAHMRFAKRLKLQNRDT
ncbi:uncharacterized protein LOC100899156 [Galendromus occidentalis]|uniref:Uncharacterized protein LOC100899156 n=1 Tax=Galendromus occidentalis TaxID=34638 RepID=A0AAJ6QYX4_9ACAR|nr:uncharacterized protein LOC100899156 [Galendromus occidentalis]